MSNRQEAIEQAVAVLLADIERWQNLLWVTPPDMTKISLNGLLGALEIGPGIKTAALGKSGFVSVK
jgi:hypothetical protein